MTADHPAVSPTRSRVAVLAASLLGTLVSLGVRVVSPHRVSLANLASIPLTVAGIGCVDYAAFHLGSGWGWLVTGLSLILLEHMIADEGEAR